VRRRRHEPGQHRGRSAADRPDWDRREHGPIVEHRHERDRHQHYVDLVELRRQRILERRIVVGRRLVFVRVLRLGQQRGLELRRLIVRRSLLRR
jgi:hypothetical protein